MILFKGKGARRKQSKDIPTPFAVLGDDPMSCAPDWASRLAVEALSLRLPAKELPAEIRKSYAYEFIVKMMRFAPAKASPGFNPSKHVDMNMATIWGNRHGDSAARDYLDPLLIGGAPYELLSKLAMADGSIPPSAIEAYEKLFYNCRSDSGTQCMSAIRHHMMAFGEAALTRNNTNDPVAAMKEISVMYSYTALTDMLGFWDVASGARNLSQKDELAMQRKIVSYRLTARNLAGTMSDEDAISFLNAQQAYEKQLFEQNQEEQDEDRYTEVLATWMDMLKPKLVSSRIVEPKGQKEALDKRRKTEKNIAKVDSGDKGYEAVVIGHKQKVAGHLQKEASRVRTKKKPGDSK